MFDEWKNDIEKGGFEIAAPSYTEVSSSEQAGSFAEDGKRSAATSVADSHLRQEGEKKITLTVEDPSLGTVYNFVLYLSPQNYQDDSSYENFKLTSVRRCLSYNPDIFDLELRRANGRELQSGTKFWEDLGDDEICIATAKAAPPPSLWRAGGAVDGALDQP